MPAEMNIAVTGKNGTEKDAFDMGEEALSYARLGWKVFPVWPIREGECACSRPECGSPGKHPIGRLTGDWRESATTYEATIRSWWKEVPDANIATPDYLRIDVDLKENGKESWEQLLEKHGRPDTVMCQTPSGGQHWYFRTLPGWEHSNQEGNLPPGINVRGHGTGYTLLPPSNHVSGSRYEWELSSRPQEVDIAPLPFWLADLLLGQPEDKPSSSEVTFAKEKSDKPDLAKFGLSTLHLTTIKLGHRSGIDRSDVDQSIITALVRKGADDDEIKAIFDHYPIGTDGKYADKGKHGQTYLAHSIKKARQYVERNGPDEKPPEGGRSKKATTADYKDALRSLGFSFRMNLLDDRIEVNGRRLADAMTAVIDNRMYDMGFRSKRRINNVCQEMAWENRYHPVQDYLDNLKREDGDHLVRLMDFLSFDEEYYDADPNWAYRFLRRWLIGAVAKAYEPAQNFCLILDGPQGIGKSYLARWLCPLPEHFSESPFRAGHKDSRIRKMNNWIWELGELQGVTRRSDREALKHEISEKMVEARRPYAKYSMKKNNLTSFIGTINDSGGGFLDDPTGHRRFVILRIERIDWKYTDAIDVDQLWALARDLYRQGEDWRLSLEEKDRQRELNLDYEEVSPLAELFFTYFEVKDGLEEWMPAMEIVRVLEGNGLNGPQRGNLMELSELMKKLDVPKSRRRMTVERNGESQTKRVSAYKGVIHK